MLQPSLWDAPPASLKPLRGRQVDAPEKIIAALREGHKHIVAQAPTGFGKTILSAHLVERCLKKGNRALFIAPSINLVEQTLASFEAQGINDVGIMQQQHRRTDHTAALQIACLKTLINRPVPDVQMVIIDECHEQSDFIYGLFKDKWRTVSAIGLSATPWARGMGRHFTKLVVIATMRDLMEDGAPTGLCPWWGFSVPEDFVPDVSKVARNAGKLSDDGLSKVMADPKLVGNAVETWLKHREFGNHPGDRTFLYAIKRLDARAYQEAFAGAGVRFGYMDGESSLDERREIFRQYDAREIAGICNVGVLITGVDKDVRCIVDCCYTESEMRLVQQHGRGMRLKADGAPLFVLDHAGNRERLGNPEDIHHDTLDMRPPESKDEAFEGEKPAPKPRKCKQCYALIPASARACPQCGASVVIPKIEHLPGELIEMGKKPKKDHRTMEHKQTFFSGMLQLAKDRGKPEGWAAHRYRDWSGVWPNQLAKIPAPPTSEVLQFDRHSRIKWAKSKEAEARRA